MFETTTYTPPLKINPIEKENHLPNVNFLGSILIFRGVVAKVFKLGSTTPLGPRMMLVTTRMTWITGNPYPIASMGLVYSPTFIINMNQM